jgi:tRNA pseudouridine38-40 synthase
MRNIKLIIQYNGANYSGWQSQPEGKTIQGLFEDALKTITGEEINVIASGRTDAGVHALGQCACFMTGSLLAPDVLRDALNAHLPLDIRVMSAEEVAADFHARFSALNKSYIYLISTSRIISPFLLPFLWRIPQKLDVDAMTEAMDLLKGTHDFSAFRASGCGAKTAVRTITEASLNKLDKLNFMSLQISGDFLRFRFEGDAFLRHMVRNMVGTIVEVGKGRMQPGDITKLFAQGDRRCAGPTAPAQGLFLEKITY